MGVSRRTIILGAAGGAVLLGSGATWRVLRKPTTAIEPWTLDPSPLTDVRLDAFRHAILAPNPHNRQPWLIRLVGEDAAELSCDLSRRLPETDPFDRQITIGFGCFIELAAIAAAQRGFSIAVMPSPDGEAHPRLDARPLAKLIFRRETALPRDPLYRTILERRTNRLVYDAAPPPEAALAAVAQEGVSVSTDPALINRIRPITVGAMTTEVTTRRTWMESVRLSRIGAREIDAAPDGLAMQGPMMEAFGAAGLLTRTQLADPDSTAFKTGLQTVQEMCGSFAALTWIITPGNSRADQIDAGRRYARANLQATAQGLAMHPLSQALQEYPEVAGAFAQINDMLGVPSGARLQMLARIGTAAAVPPSPRWPLETHLA